MSPTDLKAVWRWLAAFLLGLTLLLVGLAAGAEVPPADKVPDAAGLPPGLKDGETGRAAKVLDGRSLVLEDGRIVRLAGIQAPPVPPWYKKRTLWPPTGKAKAALTELTRDQALRLSFDSRHSDRHNRLVAHLSDSQGRWLQGELLRRGLARVEVFPGNRTALTEMLKLEAAARDAGRGLWAYPYYAIRRHDALSEDLGQFHLVEGRVLKVAVVGGRAYLNFGDDWRSDFTLVIDPAQRRKFEAEGFDPVLYQGRRVRVRGWLEFRNGVTINITHPEQIEVLD